MRPRGEKTGAENDRYILDGSFSSNAERLTMREGLGVLFFVALAASFVGPVWAKLEGFEPSDDYRIPYAQSDDYWLFERYCAEAGEPDKTFVIGDSFVWGQYVGREESLSHFLNVESGADQFVNAGLDGAHPLALEGLIRHHCPALRHHDVILHLNLLWMSSTQADLKTAPGSRINHPRLIPQFAPRIPGYDASYSDRIGVVMGRLIPSTAWSHHIRSSYFSSTDLPYWTLENPYSNPVRQITLVPPEPENQAHRQGQPWFDGMGGKQDLPWIDLETSLQWKAFTRLLRLLETRGNSLFILVGPLNEHMLESASLSAYRVLVSAVEANLLNRGSPFYLAPVLPSEMYADLSHPLGEGYSLLAEGLWRRLSGTR